jgi:hydroxymethylglutaryl-CoA reductase
MTTLARVPRARTSRVSGFAKLTPAQRRARLQELGWLKPEAARRLEAPLCDEPVADTMIENVIGVHALPMAVAMNFRVDGVDRVIPMSVEEPSIVAACSYAARMAGEGGGFTTEADAPVLTAQVQLLDVPDVVAAAEAVRAASAELLAAGDALIPAMVARGGGLREVEARILEADQLVVHLHVDCRDAMGANTVNVIAEALAPQLAALTGGRVGLRILTNLSDRRKVTVRCAVPFSALASEGWPDGRVVAERIVEAQRFAEADPYRAVTHNKGVMNGVDAVLVAFGNDWRAVEAGAHAWAARHGRYGPLTSWAVEGEALVGSLTLPLATSTVGGAARTHEGVKLALELSGVASATELAGLAAAAGLASNLAALKALSTEGIIRGHMELHARRIAVEVGATEELVEPIAAQLSRERCWRPERALELLAQHAQRMAREAGATEALVDELAAQLLAERALTPGRARELLRIRLGDGAAGALERSRGAA